MCPPSDWRDDKRWSDRFIPELKRIAAEHLIRVAPEEEDAKRNTDLIVLAGAGARIACRVRKFHYIDRYADQFTLREVRYSGAKTELAKLREGFGDYFIYAFADQEERALASWIVGDLRIFRRWYEDCIAKTGREPGEQRANGDGSSGFRAFALADLPKGFVLSRQLYVPAFTRPSFATRTTAAVGQLRWADGEDPANIEF